MHLVTGHIVEKTESRMVNPCITIIIPTHERHGVLRRSIDYYQSFDCNILIVDSSSKKLNYEFPGNVIYKHLPGVSFAKKIYEVAKSIITAGSRSDRHL